MKAITFWVPGHPIGINKKYVGSTSLRGKMVLTPTYRGFVARVHAYGLAARMGWAPLAQIKRRSLGLIMACYNARLDCEAISKPVCDALEGVFYEKDSALMWCLPIVRPVGAAGEGVRLTILPPAQAVALLELLPPGVLLADTLS